MKTLFASLITVAAFSLASCGAPSSGGGVGFDTPKSTSAAAPVSLQTGKAPGIYKTASGVPWTVYHSRSLKRGNGAVSEAEAMKLVIDRSMNVFTGPDAVRVKNANGSAPFSVVTLDGSTFGVVRLYQKARPIEFGIDIRAETVDILQRGIKLAGCEPKGSNFLVRTMNSTTSGIAMPINC